jgi:two-component system chemotaxis sensor kinase CheA
MKTRMQPVGNVWNKFPRVVRDLAKACGKQVRLEMEGRDTDLDKSILEAIKDPLTHLVRNSIDHGIEMPEARLAAGKPAEGVVLMRAYHEGGLVNIEISDDGAGIDVERVRAKAIEKSLVTPERAAQMPDREVANLIFMPGFSTAEKVTNVSGRGVGMDVVKTNIEKIGGTIDLLNRPGSGSTVKIKIPLTLAIIPALVVENRFGCYAIPQVSLVELVRVDTDRMKTAIEMIHGAPTYRLRGNLLPLVFLDDELGLTVEETEERAMNIVVLRSDAREFGVVVDTIRDTEEIVVKPLDKQLKDIAVFAGATIMGDGRIALILDVLGLAQRANVIAETSENAAVQNLEHSASHDGRRQTLLVLGVGESGRLALPLSAVARLEQFKRDTVEHTGGYEVVQYRGHIMPLVDIGGYLGMARRYDEEPSAEIPVVVYEHRGRSVGLVIDQVLDIVEAEMTIEPVADRSGIVGAAVIEDHVTDVLDVVTIVESALPPSVFTDEAAEADVTVGV